MEERTLRCLFLSVTYTHHQRRIKTSWALVHWNERNQVSSVIFKTLLDIASRAQATVP